MALWSSRGFCHLGWRDMRSREEVDASFMKRSVEMGTIGKWGRGGLCIKTVDDENAASSSSSPTPSMELSDGTMKSTRDLGPLPKPLSATDIHASTEGSNVRVAYQGSPGAFSEVAALKAYPQSETVPCEQFEVVFKAVELWVVDKAVLPIESTVGGSIHQNYDLLLRHRLHIVGEVQLAVNHCLMALPGVKKEELKRLLSHPQAFSQCETALNKLSIILENTDGTAAAAQLVSSKNLRDAGAIASVRAAQIYGLHILERGIQMIGIGCGKNSISSDKFLSHYTYLSATTKATNSVSIVQWVMQDCPNNVTRFMILAREPIIPSRGRPFKTSIVFTLEEGPGMLFKALAVFALRKINLTKVESRPQRNRPLRVVDDTNYGTAKYFDYLFHIDFEASMAEPRAQNALSHLQEFATFLRVLGSYPMDVTPL